MPTTSSNNQHDPIVITGIGVITSVGTDRETLWNALVAGHSGIDRIQAFDPAPYATQIASEVHNFDATRWLDRKLARRMARNSQFAAAAAVDAVRDAGLDLNSMPRERVGVCVGTAAGDYVDLEEQHSGFLARGPRAVSPFCVPKVIPNMPAANVAITLDLHGPNLAAISACATGAHSIGIALDLLRAGRADVMLAGGTEATITPFVLSGYMSMGALSTRNDEPTRASRPFDVSRDGFVMGEGAGVLVLERLSHARARGAAPIAELAGFGMTSDAFGIAQPDPEGRWAARAMELALQDARLDRSEVGYVNAHGTSTPANDSTESRALKSVFGPDSVPAVSSTKSMIGHTLGAAGAVEAAITALALRHSTLPPTINLEQLDPECSLDVVPNKARPAAIKAAMSNSFGFGGQNAVLAFRAVPA